jgi:hypothetical protein
MISSLGDELVSKHNHTPSSSGLPETTHREKDDFPVGCIPSLFLTIPDRVRETAHASFDGGTTHWLAAKGSTTDAGSPR